MKSGCLISLSIFHDDMPLERNWTDIRIGLFIFVFFECLFWLFPLPFPCRLAAISKSFLFVKRTRHKLGHSLATQDCLRIHTGVVQDSTSTQTSRERVHNFNKNLENVVAFEHFYWQKFSVLKWSRRAWWYDEAFLRWVLQ